MMWKRGLLTTPLLFQLRKNSVLAETGLCLSCNKPFFNEPGPSLEEFKEFILWCQKRQPSRSPYLKTIKGNTKTILAELEVLERYVNILPHRSSIKYIVDGANLTKSGRLSSPREFLNPGETLEISRPSFPFFIRPLTSDPASGKKYFLDIKLVFADYDDLLCIFTCLLLPKTRIYTADNFFDHVRNAHKFSESFGREFSPFLSERLCKNLQEECLIDKGDVIHTLVGRSSICEAKEPNTSI